MSKLTNFSCGYFFITMRHKLTEPWRFFLLNFCKRPKFIFVFEIFKNLEGQKVSQKMFKLCQDHFKFNIFFEFTTSFEIFSISLKKLENFSIDCEMKRIDCNRRKLMLMVSHLFTQVIFLHIRFLFFFHIIIIRFLEYIFFF